AQLDRFMFRILIDYPTFEEELQIAETTTSQDKPDLNSMLDSAEIMQLQQVVRKVIVGKSIAAYAVRLVRGTRPFSDESPQFVKDYLTWGAGPRACQALLMGAKANALLEGRFHASIDDIRYVAFPVLRHRLVTSFSAESDGVTTDKIISDLCDQTSEEL
ncbi:MAG TPA: AAA family ATPase, partial [Planctomycetaceae bacterium]|nr:AAA family ATPase [Planctomycetaceae bacterium]